MILPLRIALAATLMVALALTGAEAARHKHRPNPARNAVPSQVLDYAGGSVLHTAVTPSGSLRAVWSQYGPSGVLEVRVVVEGGFCPILSLDMRFSRMEIRAKAGAGFQTVCGAVIPAATKQAALVLPIFKSPLPADDAGFAMWSAWFEREAGAKLPDANAPLGAWDHFSHEVASSTKYDLVPLPVPVSDPQRILVLGDTGCRVKGTALQDCSNEDTWPFARIAREAAKLKPDLVIHVGDYLYRENACPADFKGCQGSPWGDNWPTWDADFFAPAKPLLAVAPWVIVRGNHEDCARAGAGFLRLLGPSAFDPAAACSDHLPQYSIPFAALNLVVADNADAPEQSVVEKSVPTYRAEIAALANEKTPTWWVTHRPVWGLISGPLNVPIGGNQTLIAAAGRDGIPAPVELMLSGHIHTFEAINYEPENHVPPQLVAGFGGDMLDPTPEYLRGAIFQGDSGVHVRDGLSIGGFGFVLMTRQESGWRLDVYDAKGVILRVCQFRDRTLLCPHKKR